MRPSRISGWEPILGAELTKRRLESYKRSGHWPETWGNARGLVVFFLLTGVKQIFSVITCHNSRVKVHEVELTFATWTKCNAGQTDDIWKSC